MQSKLDWFTADIKFLRASSYFLNVYWPYLAFDYLRMTGNWMDASSSSPLCMFLYDLSLNENPFLMIGFIQQQPCLQCFCILKLLWICEQFLCPSFPPLIQIASQCLPTVSWYLCTVNGYFWQSSGSRRTHGWGCCKLCWFGGLTWKAVAYLHIQQLRQCKYNVAIFLALIFVS